MSKVFYCVTLKLRHFLSKYLLTQHYEGGLLQVVQEVPVPQGDDVVPHPLEERPDQRRLVLTEVTHRRGLIELRLGRPRGEAVTGLAHQPPALSMSNE